MLFYKKNFIKKLTSRISIASNDWLYSFFVGFIGIFLISFSPIINAATENQLEDIRSAAEIFVQGQVEKPSTGILNIKAASLDSRIRATDCPTPLQVTAPGKQSRSGNITVLVECEDDGWRVYVPVKTKLMMPLVIAVRPLNRGTIINESDLHIELTDVNLSRGTGFSSIEKLIGSRIKRSVRHGDTINSNDICLVCRNDEVIIKAVRSGLSIITKGTALNDGALGEQVKVKNNKSNRIIDGTITNVGEVSVNF